MDNSHCLIAAILLISAGFMLTIAAIANAQMMGTMSSMFRKGVRAGVATGPQAGICGLLTQSQLTQPPVAPNTVGGTALPCGSGLTFDSKPVNVYLLERYRQQMVPVV